MRLHKHRVKEKVAQLLLAALLVQIGTGSSYAAPVQINTGDINLTILAPIAATINSASLVKWRTGTANQAPVAATSLTSAYVASASGTNLAIPSRANPKDNSANNQGDMWFDNAIALSYTKPNSIGSAILIYSSNSVTGAQDPLGNVSLRGGLVGCSQSWNASATPETCPVANDPSRASVIPLIWKALQVADLMTVSGATVNGSSPIPANHPLYMPTEITAQTGGSCPAEGPYTAATRTNNGFCDFSTHYFVDRTNTDPNNKFYDQYPSGSTQHNTAFDYSSLVGPFGVNTTEQGSGAGQFNPMYAVLGTNLTNAIQAHYGTTIYVEVLTR